LKFAFFLIETQAKTEKNLKNQSFTKENHSYLPLRIDYALR
jgi:hypothetical protein